VDEVANLGEGVGLHTFFVDCFNYIFGIWNNGDDGE
jgi:hypothetical protein